LRTDNVRWGQKRRRNCDAFLNQKTNAAFVEPFEKEVEVFTWKVAERQAFKSAHPVAPSLSAGRLRPPTRGQHNEQG
jgi:hypothetical protein